MQKQKTFYLACTFIFLLCQNKAAFGASAVSVPVQAKQTAAMAKAEAEQIRQRQQNEVYRQEAEKYALAAEREAQRAQAETNTVQERLLAAEASSAATAEADYQQEVARLRNAYHDCFAYSLKARAYAEQAQTELARITAALANSGGSYFASTGAKLYDWHADAGVKGYQFAQALNVGYWSRGFSYGLFTHYVSSHSKTAGETGHYNGFTDTLLFLSKRQDVGKNYFNYGLGINIPTGKAALKWGQRYARFNEDLVAVEQFGKGWQFTPGLSFSFLPYERDTWTVGSSYIYSRAYDPTADVAGDRLTPGGEWTNFLRYQHAGEKWQVVATILNTAYGRSKLANGSSYRTKKTWEYQVTVNRKLSATDELMFYYWPERQNRNDLPFSSATSLAHYLGTTWSRQLDNKRTLRVPIDFMKTNGARYAGIYNAWDLDGNPYYLARDVHGRKKLSVGLGYDYLINSKSSLSLDVKYFTMHDGKSTLGEAKRKYKGFNIFLSHYLQL